MLSAHTNPVLANILDDGLKLKQWPNAPGLNLAGVFLIAGLRFAVVGLCADVS